MEYIYKNDASGNTVLVDTVETAVSAPAPDWAGLTNQLYSSATFNYAITTPNALNLVMYTTLLKVLTDGENGSSNATEGVLLTFMSQILTYTDAQKAEVNGILAANGFTIQIA